MIKYFGCPLLSLLVCNLLKCHVIVKVGIKVTNGLCHEILRDIFQINTNPNRRTTFVIPKVKGEFMGKLSLRYFGPVVWEIMLLEKYEGITELERI